MLSQLLVEWISKPRVCGDDPLTYDIFITQEV